MTGDMISAVYSYTRYMLRVRRNAFLYLWVILRSSQYHDYIPGTWCMTNYNGHGCRRSRSSASLKRSVLGSHPAAWLVVDSAAYSRDRRADNLWRRNASTPRCPSLPAARASRASGGTCRVSPWGSLLERGGSVSVPFLLLFTTLPLNIMNVWIR